MQDLVALVRVSTRWQVIVEAMIWRDLPSLAPLLRLLNSVEIVYGPQSVPVCPYTHRKEDVVCLEQIGDLPTTIWRAHPSILRLAGHVRTLLLHPINDFRVDCKLDTFHPNSAFLKYDVFKTAAASLDQAHSLILFPRLRTLEVNCSLFHGFPGRLLRPFMKSGITSIVAHCPITQFNQLDRSLINNFQFFQRSVHLNCKRGMGAPIVVRQSVLVDPTVGAIVGQIGSFHTLALRLLYSQDLHILLTPCAQHLRSLDLDIMVLADPVTTYALQCLRFLTVRNPFACALMGSPDLENTTLQLATITGSQDIAQALNMMGETCRPDVLRRVRIYENVMNCEWETWYITRAHLTALMPFHGLVEVDLRTTGELSMSDTDWDVVVPHWDNLRIFKIEQSFAANPSPDTVPSPETTLRTLITFATYCPKLEELGLQIHAATIPTLAGPQLALSQTSLRKLNVGRDACICGPLNGPLPYPTLVFNFLRSLFPSLNYLNAAPKRRDRLLWGAVRDALATL
ncbi:hypothetical protein BD626DRAFT_575549 [Schizophyllum amplum]|uniref:F-box domain-containing protein n=1 Tax=Schizophyllum amplum TaxID=97359 RepID=A0A550BVD8_9AGAR|nr:hypothetical protein BD626DRAFT_575549 [Auriculariopsis ampla]